MNQAEIHHLIITFSSEHLHNGEAGIQENFQALDNKNCPQKTGPEFLQSRSD